jgi:hypothetical protein
MNNQNRAPVKSNAALAVPAKCATSIGSCVLFFVVVYTVMCPFWLCWLLFEHSWPRTEYLNYKLQDWAGWSISTFLVGIILQLWFHFIGKVLCCFLSPLNREHHGCWRMLDTVEWIFTMLLLAFVWFLAVYGSILIFDCDLSLASWWFGTSIIMIDTGCYFAGVWQLMVMVGWFVAPKMGGNSLQTVNEMSGKHRLIVPKKVRQDHFGHELGGKGDAANYVGDCDWC